MSRLTSTISSVYFDSRYKDDIDPWHFRSSPYEQAKYAATLSALSRPSFKMALEVGCSIGVLTAMLAGRCTALLAVDASETAIAEARRYCVGRDNIDLRVAMLPHQFPEGRYDLIVLSEVLYYFSDKDLTAVANLCQSSLLPQGEIILCHWLGETNYPLPGRDASDLFADAVVKQLPVRSILNDAIYRLERFSHSLAGDAAGAI